MTDKELADRVVELGVGKSLDGHYPPQFFFEDNVFTPHDFVRDPRVAMALMEKCVDANCIVDCALIGRTDAFGMKGPYVAECNTPEKVGHTADGDNIPRAITEACVEALDE